MTVLTELTPAQAALLPAIRDDWLAIGLATGPADREQAERGVRLAYEAAGLRPPSTVIWLRSPIEGALAVSMLQEVAPEGSRSWRAIGTDAVRVDSRIPARTSKGVQRQVDNEVRWPVAARVGTPVGYALRVHVSEDFSITVDRAWADEVWQRVQARLRDQRAGRRTSLNREAVWPKLRGAVPHWHHHYGQHNVDDLPSRDALARLGIAADRRLDGLKLAARACGWWWPLADAVVMTERPTKLARDSAGRFHNETGPAIAYPDGYAVWAWHGVRVARDVIEQPEALTVDDIQDAPNVEVRRIMVGRYGLPRFLRDAGATLMHADDHGRLWRLEQRYEEPLAVVQVLNSTDEPDGSRREYFLRVPPGMRTALEAVAWTFDMPPEQYRTLSAET